MSKEKTLKQIYHVFHFRTASQKGLLGDVKCCISFTHPCQLYIHFKSSRHEPDSRRPNNAVHCAHFVGLSASVVLRRSVAQV